MTIHHGRPQLIPLGNGASAERAAYDEAMAPLRRLRRQLASVKGSTAAARSSRSAPSAEQLAILKRAGVDVAAFLSATDAAPDAPSGPEAGGFSDALLAALAAEGVDVEAFLAWAGSTQASNDKPGGDGPPMPPRKLSMKPTTPAQILGRAGVTDLEAFTRWQARQGR
jgi:hypothetical protein